MVTKKKAVFGIFRNVQTVSSTVDALRAAGFSNEDVSVLMPESSGTREFAMEKGTKAPEGAVAGGASGAVIGGALGWLVGIGSLAIPGVGPFIAAGPIMAALAGAGVVGAVGGVAGALAGMEIPEYEAKRYETLLKEGGILMSVHCASDAMVKKAKDIFELKGAEGIDSRREDKAPTPPGRKGTVTSTGKEMSP